MLSCVRLHLCVFLGHLPDLREDDARVEWWQKVWQGLQVGLLSDTLLQVLCRHLLGAQLDKVTQSLHFAQSLILSVWELTQRLRISWKHTRSKRRWVRIRRWLPVWLRAWCDGYFPCSRPRESGQSANPQMPHESLTYNRHKSPVKQKADSILFFFLLPFF